MTADGTNNPSTGREEAGVGPLGLGKEYEKDPLSGLAGMMSGALIMQAISVLLGLPVVMRVDDGAYATTFNLTYVGVFGIALVILAFLQRRPWALKANIVMQVFGVGLFLVHWSLGIVGVLFALVWWYIFNLRKRFIERRERGLLTTQHT